LRQEEGLDERVELNPGPHLKLKASSPIGHPPSLITLHGQLSKPNVFLKNANMSKVKTKLTGTQNQTMSILFCHQAQQLSWYFPADASVLCKKAAVVRDTIKDTHRIM